MITDDQIEQIITFMALTRFSLVDACYAVLGPDIMNPLSFMDGISLHRRITEIKNKLDSQIKDAHNKHT
jgi:hypothetical protein